MDDFNDDYDLTVPKYFDHGLNYYYTTFKSVLKLLLILASYAAVFVSLVQFGFWSYQARQADFDGITFWQWLNRSASDDRWDLPLVATYLLLDFALLVLFGVQHSCMAARNLIMTKYWEIVHYVWEIDKAVYNLMTAAVLQAIIKYWQPVGIYLWKIESLSEFQFAVHIIAWAVFYGTNLMIDLPDLIGLNQQVMIECPNKIAKSPELKTMIENQRHMGLLPLATILLVHPYMSLDRFILTFGTLIYTCCSWRSQSCYPYAKSMRTVKRYTVYAKDR